jgi:hypothetical protein
MDSRTAAFDRKRPVNHDSIDSDDGNPEADRKRLKQDTTAAGNSHVPIMRWNAGASSGIRVSFGSNRTKQDATSTTAPVLPPPEASNKVMTHRVQTRDDEDSSDERSEEDISSDQDTSDGGSTGVMLNLEDIGQNNYRPSQIQRQVIDLVSDSESLNSAAINGDETSDDGEIYNHTDANLGTKNGPELTEEKAQPETTSPTSPVLAEQLTALANSVEGLYQSRPAPHTLADLGPSELKEQLKYFYVGKQPGTVSLSDPVRCLICAKEGHTSTSCPAMTCASCLAVNDHFTRDCPKIRKCRKCRNIGHDLQDCPYKLPRLVLEEVQCDLCQRMGHFEDQCELLWRTSGRPWESDAVSRNIPLYCYECGWSGHLGNDCSTRHPRKPLGSSTWSANIGRTQPGKGMNIKGLAQQEKSLGYESDKDFTFIRPRLPPPSRQGNIRVVAPGRGPQPNDLSPPNAGRIPRTVQRHNAPDPMRGDRKKPPPRDRPPLRHEEERDPQGSNNRYPVYRPMPSSAQAAWKKGRF